MLSKLFLYLWGYVCRAWALPSCVLPRFPLHFFLFVSVICHLLRQQWFCHKHKIRIYIMHSKSNPLSFPTAIPSCPWNPACYLNCHEHWVAVAVWKWTTSILKCHIKYSWLRGLLWPTTCWAFSSFIEVDCVFVRPRGMRGSPLGRSWPLAVSMTTDRLPLLAAARAAKTACPHGQCALLFSELVVCLM